MAKIKVRFGFFRVSASHIRNLGCAFSQVFQKLPWGVLIGAGVLNRVNMVIEIALLESAHIVVMWFQVPLTLFRSSLFWSVILTILLLAKSPRGTLPVLSANFFCH